MELYFALFIHLIAIINSVHLRRIPVTFPSSLRAANRRSGESPAPSLPPPPPPPPQQLG